MNRSIFIALLPLAVVLLLGGACQKKAPVVNTSVSSTSNTTVNVSANINSSTTGSFNTATASGQASVTISSAGVEPSTINVTAGTTVTFTNNDSITHQISSDPHPAHTDLPGFDGVISAGDSYSFTFSRTGTFRYHDHLDSLNGRFKGSVVVQ